MWLKTKASVINLAMCLQVDYVPAQSEHCPSYIAFVTAPMEGRRNSTVIFKSSKREHFAKVALADIEYGIRWGAHSVDITKWEDEDVKQQKKDTDPAPEKIDDPKCLFDVMVDIVVTRFYQMIGKKR